jgi:hypothetical protein
MTSPETNEPPAAQPEPVLSSVPCRHLRNKGMYVYSDGNGGEAHDDYDNTIYWCVKTMKEYGPDDEIVGGPDCHNTLRTCYEPF